MKQNGADWEAGSESKEPTAIAGPTTYWMRSLEAFLL